MDIQKAPQLDESAWELFGGGFRRYRARTGPEVQAAGMMGALRNGNVNMFYESKSISVRSMSLKANHRNVDVSHAHRKVHMRPI